MASESSPNGAPGGNGQHEGGPADLTELKELLLGPERRRLADAERRLEQGLTAEQLAEQLPAAIVSRSGKDRQLAHALAPTIEGAISESVRRNPKEFATAIFPILGPAIRKAIAETMAALVRSINAAVEHSFSFRGLKWRIESWRTGVPFAEIVLKHSLVYRVEQVFLIHSESGLLLAHVAPRDLAVADADLVAGMLTAIQDFAADSFKVEDEGARLRTFAVGALTGYVERGPSAMIAAVVRGEPPAGWLRRLQDTLENVHLQLSRQFAAFSGDAKPFEPAVPLLEDCLETVLTTDDATGRRTAWLSWAIPVALLVLLGGALWWRAERRWRAAATAVRQTPGVVVVAAERGWRRWRFEGLKDPAAADPKLALASAGVDTSRVETAWQPFLSLDPAIVLERARRAWAAPPTVKLALSGDSLVVTGSAPLAWLGQVATGPALPLGVGHADLGRVEALLPDSLLGTKRRIEDRLILFSTGSAGLGSGSAAAIRQVADAESVLETAVSADGFGIRLDVVGRTDQTGSDWTNRALSQLRADAVRDELVRAGVPVESIRATGIDGRQPLPGADAADRSARNRSVAFVVHLVPPGGGAKELR